MYEVEDTDMCEIGQDFEQITKLKFDFIEKKAVSLN